jgi:glyoxylase-like metal-dependent hydrolase (beta-lactamase superfamily II)
VKFWEPEQSHVPGGEMRFANESNYELFTDVATRTTAIDWSRKFAYPAPRVFTFGEIVTPTVGYVSGIDSNGRTKQSMEAKPPAHNMSGLRLAAIQRELRRASPLLLLEMSKSPDRIVSVPDVTVGGATFPAVEYRAAENQVFTVLFDKATGLPARVRSMDYDNINGDVTFDLVLGNWKTFEGVKVATSRKYELNGRTVIDATVKSARPNASIATDRLEIPAAFKTGAPKPATGTVPYQWVLRRQFIGTYLDSDAPSYDTRASQGLRFNQVAPGVQHVVGGSHHALVVEMKDHLVVIDAPVNDAHSMFIIGEARAKYPNKPIKFLVLTHHHMDHAGGLRGFAAQGATLVVGKGAAAHYKKVLAMPFTRNPDFAPSDLGKTAIVEVDGKHVLSDGTRELHAYVVDNNGHADGLLIGYLPKERLGFSTDIWSPGAPLGAKLTPGQDALVKTVKKHRLDPGKFAGGHGSTADYSTLAALEGK